MLPTFLGLGVPRAATTWLHELLDRHPEVYVPKRRKEVHFFDKNYDLGINWYETFFPSNAYNTEYKAIGEITARYLSCEQCPERIIKTPSITKFIVILRNPINRAFSHYGMRVREGLYSGSFESFLFKHPDMISLGFYSCGFEKYFNFFKREQFLILIFEKAMSNIEKTKEVLANFLNVSLDKFPVNAGNKEVNKSYIPKFKFAYSLSANFARNLRNKNMDWLVNLVKRFGLKKLFGKNKSVMLNMKKETYENLRKIYGSEITKLENLLNMDLGCWK
ncbi:sulfotransferase domain-containing protein [bacterium]|nr:sulfotransferase domain-containing protein [bacterium]